MKLLAVFCASFLVVCVSFANVNCTSIKLPPCGECPGVKLGVKCAYACDPSNTNPVPQVPVEDPPIALPPCGECPGAELGLICAYRCDPNIPPVPPKLPPCNCPGAPKVKCSFKCDPNLPITSTGPKLPACNCPGAPKVACKFRCDPTIPITVDPPTPVDPVV